MGPDCQPQPHATRTTRVPVPSVVVAWARLSAMCRCVFARSPAALWPSPVRNLLCFFVLSPPACWPVAAVAGSARFRLVGMMCTSSVVGQYRAPPSAYLSRLAPSQPYPLLHPLPVAFANAAEIAPVVLDAGELAPPFGHSVSFSEDPPPSLSPRRAPTLPRR